MKRRYTAHPDVETMHAFFRDSLEEFERVLKPGGVLILKIGNSVHGNGQNWNTYKIHDWAEAMGLEHVDEIIFENLHHRIVRGDLKQHHARKTHCLFMVFIKRKRRGRKPAPKPQVTSGELFAGIGGLSLGLENLGVKTKWQVEIDPACQKVLAKNFPESKKFGDVKNFPPKGFNPHVDILVGGFPCQPASIGGARSGTHDRRWLWPEFNRIIPIVQPRAIIIENVPGLLTLENGEPFSQIVRSISQHGYHVGWGLKSARAVGAPHFRNRLWVLAVEASISGEVFRRECSTLFATHPKRNLGESIVSPRPIAWNGVGVGGEDPISGACLQLGIRSPIRRVDDGLSRRVDRGIVGMLGNAVVPQVAEFVARGLVGMIA